jgi:hypothetical protein
LIFGGLQDEPAEPVLVTRLSELPSARFKGLPFSSTLSRKVRIFSRTPEFAAQTVPERNRSASFRAFHAALIEALV